MQPNPTTDQALSALARLLAPYLIAHLPAYVPPPVGYTPPDPDEQLNTQEAAKLMTYKETTLVAWRREGKGPKFSRPGGRVVRYRRGDLVKWMEEQRGGGAK
ncbi:helix-turn-helix transcriptional regulator [Thiocapsa sp. UBA6158]|uniref:helix-turn-helix transcriptional regulator n=1 Tax=Thiocapsa sp. UBA6158 TaxID=1947692 RepID=UPI0025E069DE|nr:helix-turn-helix domain-containing protein [Thiocapsa sp. UBA6158]